MLGGWASEVLEQDRHGGKRSFKIGGIEVIDNQEGVWGSLLGMRMLVKLAHYLT